MEKLEYHLQVFDGPLDLLLALIAKNKLDIYDIPIAELLDQYLEQIALMREADMDVASEFLEMAARLVQIKAASLLPQHEQDEEDPRAELTGQLLEFLIQELLIAVRKVIQQFRMLYHIVFCQTYFFPVLIKRDMHGYSYTEDRIVKNNRRFILLQTFHHLRLRKDVHDVFTKALFPLGLKVLGALIIDVKDRPFHIYHQEPRDLVEILLKSFTINPIHSMPLLFN